MDFRGAAAMGLMAAMLALPALAQNFTTAAEVKPILSATKGQWIGVRDWEGQDLIYFTNLLSWRCGVESVAWGVNGGPANRMLVMEPCYEGEAAPNALKMDQGVLPYVAEAPGSVQTVAVTVTYDDGTTETAEYERAAVFMP